MSLVKYSAALLFALDTQQSFAQSFTPIQTLPQGAYGAAAWGDLDGDGWQDVVYITQALPNTICKIYHNTSNVFTEVDQHFPALYNAAAKWTDLDNDGDDDLVMNGMDTTFHNRTFIYQSNGDGTFISMPNNIFPLSAGSVDVMDYNNDGLMDIAIAGNDSVGVNHAFIYKGLTAFTFSDINASLAGIHFGEVKWGDYDNDGLADLVVNGIGDNNDFRARVYKNNGADNFQLQSFYLKGSSGTADWMDYNNDGWKDLLITGYDSTFGNNFTELHQNNSDGTFSTVATNLPDFGEPSSVAIADYNNDGNYDICFMGGSSFNFNFSALALGQGSTTYTVNSFLTGNVENAIVETADMDGDGDWDLIFDNLILRNENIATAVTEFSGSKKEFTLYPNPADEKIFIKSSGRIQIVSIFDIYGRKLKDVTIHSAIPVIDVSDLKDGLYIVKNNLDGESTAQTLMIVHL